MLEAWVNAGQCPSRFWHLTLREIGVVLTGAALRLRREDEGRAWLAWHIEALARQKKLPKLNELMPGSARKMRRRQSLEEQIAIAHQWTLALGGMRT